MALEKKLYGIEEVQVVIPGISRASLYNACKRQEIPSVRELAEGYLYQPGGWRRLHASQRAQTHNLDWHAAVKGA